MELEKNKALSSVSNVRIVSTNLSKYSTVLIRDQYTCFYKRLYELYPLKFFYRLNVLQLIINPSILLLELFSVEAKMSSYLKNLKHVKTAILLTAFTNCVYAFLSFITSRFYLDLFKLLI